LQTERLILRPLALADADQVQLLFPKWEIVRQLASIVPWPYPEDGVRNFYEQVALPAVERGDEWYWTIRFKTQPDQIIGAVSVSKGSNNRGFWMGLPWQGQGYMSEASEAATDFWFNTLGFEVMRIPKAADNVASRRISEKQGMRVVETKLSEYVSGTLTTEVWEITAEEWRKRRQNMVS